MRLIALYKGDKFIDIGTFEELATKLNIKLRTLYYYNSPSYKKRIKDYTNKIVIVDLGEENEKNKI